MENYKEEIIRTNKICAVLKTCIIFLLVALFVCFLAESGNAQETATAAKEISGTTPRDGLCRNPATR